MVAVVSSLCSVASAVPALSLRFDNVTVLGDGISPTPVQILVKVVNSGTPVAASALDARMTWTSSNANVSDLTFLTTGVVNSAGYLFNGIDPNFQSAGGSTPQVPWGINTAGEAIIATGTTNVALLNLRVVASATNAKFFVNFVTGSGAATSFTGGDPNYATIPYANGNDGSTFGVITVIPEPSTGTALGTATLLMAGVGFVQQRMRRKGRTAELVG